MTRYSSPEVRVVHRNRRWEVAVDGVTRPMIDWLCTRERALAHAEERVRELLRWEHEIALVIEDAGHVEERRVVRERRAS